AEGPRPAGRVGQRDPGGGTDGVRAGRRSPRSVGRRLPDAPREAHRRALARLRRRDTGKTQRRADAQAALAWRLTAEVSPRTSPCHGGCRLTLFLRRVL